MKKTLAAAFTAIVALGHSPVRAEDLNQIFSKVNQYVQEKNYPKAMEELTWARKELEKLHQTRVAQILPADIAGFNGEEPTFASVMGLSTIERQYRAGEKKIKLSITGGSGGEGGLGGLAGLAKMGMMMGGAQPGVEQFRIDGRTATLSSESGNPELMIFLDSGSMMTISAGEGVDAAALKKFGEALKLSDLDAYLKGSK